MMVSAKATGRTVRPLTPGVVGTGASVPPPNMVPTPVSVKASAQAPPGSLATLQQTAAARTQALEAAIRTDAYDVAAWDARIAEAVRAGEPREVFDRAVQQFPTAARFWIAYAEWAETQDTQSALQVYRRCLHQVASLDLWQAHLFFCKRRRPLEEIFRAYKSAMELLGTDCRAGHLWSEYISLLKKAYNQLQKKNNPEAEVSGRLLSEDPNPIEAARRIAKPQAKIGSEDTTALEIGDEAFLRVAEAIQVDFSTMRSAYQRAVCSSHTMLDKLWIGYEQFEKSLGNSPLAQKLLGDYMPRYLKCKAVFKDLQTGMTGLDHTAVAVPIRPNNLQAQRKLLAKWQSIIRHERTNPLRLNRDDLQARLSLLYQQALLPLAFHAEMWHDFAAWLDLGGQAEKATACLRAAVERFLPQDLTLRLLIAQRCELVKVPLTPELLRAADDEYQKILEEMPKPCPLALMNYLAYIRRQRGAADFRDAFLEATESSPHCTWEAYAFAAMVEYHVYGNTEAAAKVFRLGLERYGEREPSLLVAYVNFLTGVNDLKSVRAELSKGVLGRLAVGVRDQLANRSDKMVLDSLGFLWQKWARLERYFGDSFAVRRAMTFRDEEFRNLQRDQEVEEDVVAETPIGLGLGTSIAEVEESFRFLHCVPLSARLPSEAEALPAVPPPPPPPAASAPAATSTPAPPVSKAAPADAPASAANNTEAASGNDTTPPILLDGVVSDARDQRQKLGSGGLPGGISVHIARPDVSKMLSFKPALDIVGRKRAPCDVEQVSSIPGAYPGARPAGGGAPLGEDANALPTMIPKCLQDLLAVLPSRPLKGARPDVDYLLNVLQTVTIPPVPVKELEDFRYDSLRLSTKEDDSGLLQRLKEEMEGGSGFFSGRPTATRDRLQAKRQKIAAEARGPKEEMPASS
eukprot:TRINITY_DN541_c0_g1_i1.p1 TRINITY_DN541_c0_g1~~TRINITY_DN541_c0_g1_i1.p1  ORF type:complete len:915 (-),score=230.52 TRINITY_DN541_c0_g1_i1:389-3133(-)